MMDTERHIVEVAGLDWQIKAQDRATWICLGGQFVAKYDVPWSSGEQLGDVNSADGGRRDSLKAADCEALLQRIRVKADALAICLVMSTGS